MSLIQKLPFLKNGKTVSQMNFEGRTVEWTAKSPNYEQTNVQDVSFFEGLQCAEPQNVETENNVKEKVFLFSVVEMQYVEGRNVLLIGCVREGDELLHLGLDNLEEIQQTGVIICEQPLISHVLGSKGSMLSRISSFLETRLKVVEYETIRSKIRENEY